MSNDKGRPDRHSAQQGGKFLPALCSILGTLILLAVILTYLPLTVPKWFGFEVYHVETPSMTPELPVGSAVYVRPVEAEAVAPGEVIAFSTGESVVIHRVVQNRVVEGVFVTKGDANPVEDPDPVRYAYLIGRMELHVPVLGSLLALYASTVGKVYALLLAVSGLLFHLLAGRLRARRSEQLRRQLAAELLAKPQQPEAQAEEPVEEPEELEAPAPPKKRKKRWLRVVIALLVLVFVGSGAALLILSERYRAAKRLYDGAAGQYVTVLEPQPTAPQPSQTPTLPGEEPQPEAAAPAPIRVDFSALQAINPDVVGWIWCEGTAINYPVLRGETNDTYLRRAYDGSDCYAGSIFIDADNRPDFSDDNTVIYGHNLRDGSMFACLSDWAKEDFFAAHPTVWLLTPAQDYRIELFAGYLTDARAPVYQKSLPGERARSEYVAAALANADVPAAAPPGTGSLVLLSTCAYDYEEARYVLHGVLTPVG